MLLMSTMGWIAISVVVVILAVFIGMKIKDRYYQKGWGVSQDFQLESLRQAACLFALDKQEVLVS